jgi:hypothetical protein
MSRIDGYRTLRGSMWVPASGVAAIAAVVSYSHIYDLGRAHGGSGVPARLLPLSVDMLILVGELMLLHEADAKGKRFILAWVLVWSGILATLAANVAYGYQFGVLGAVIWDWPAYSFILAAGGMISIVKRGVSRRVFVGPEKADESEQRQEPKGTPALAQEPQFPQASAFPSPVPSNAETAAETAMRATVQAGNPLTVNQLSTRFNIPRSAATRVRNRMLAEADARQPDELLDSAVS